MLVHQMTNIQKLAAEKFYNLRRNWPGYTKMNDAVKCKADSRLSSPQRLEYTFVFVEVGGTIFVGSDPISLVFGMQIQDNDKMREAVEEGYEELTLSLWEGA